jgi:hypothetical protein
LYSFTFFSILLIGKCDELLYKEIRTINFQSEKVKKHMLLPDINSKRFPPVSLILTLSPLATYVVPDRIGFKGDYRSRILKGQSGQIRIT